MMIISNNEVLFKSPFNISHKLENLINGFNFPTDPRDGIKDVKVKNITVLSPCETYGFSFAVNDNKKALFDAIKARNFSIKYLLVKEIGLDVIFYDGFVDQTKKKIAVKISYFDQTKTVTNPVINKYLESWGLLAKTNS